VVLSEGDTGEIATVNDGSTHRALKFGREVRTPAIQAGLTKRRMTLREIFSSTIVLLGWQKVRSVFAYLKSFVIVDDRRVQLAA
jgi:hypothetical protein